MLKRTMPESTGDLKPNRNRLVTDPGELTARCRQGLNSRVAKFTKKVLAALVPAENGKDVFISTAELPCFYIRVTRDGHCSYCIQHRVTSRHTIGDVRVKTIEDALKRARVILDAASERRNLLAEEKEAKRQEQAEQTILTIVDKYLAEPAVGRKRTYKQKKHYLKTVWAPVHGEPAETVDRHALLPTLRSIAAERGERTANVARDQLSTLFIYAIEHGWLRREANPAVHLPRWEENRRERALALEELGAVWNAAPLVSQAYGAIVQLLILTGARKSEIGDLLWSEVDFDKGLISLPASRVKNGRPHLIALPTIAVETLKAQPRLGGDRVFPSITWSREKAKLDKSLQFEQPFVIHDLRRSFSTGCHEHLSADVHLIELTINHVSGSRGGVAGTYDRSNRIAERRKLLERWADKVLTAAAGGAEVVTFPAREGA
jgi:integrase